MKAPMATKERNGVKPVAESGKRKTGPASGGWINDVLFGPKAGTLRFGNVDTPRTKWLIGGSAVVLHAAILTLSILFMPHHIQSAIDPDKVIDIVELQELTPPKPQTETPPPPPPPPPKSEQPPPVSDAPPPTALAEDLGPPSDSSPFQVATAPVATAAPNPSPSAPPPGEVIEYTPQYKLTALPVAPDREFRSRIIYPPLAAKQGIEATVILQLNLDRTGRIMKITVLKDPGFGFAEAAVKALEGLVFKPGETDGQAAACVYRLPIPFKLK